MNEQDNPQEQANLVVCKNGAILDKTRGRFIANPGGGKTAITTANAQEYQRRRREKTAQAIAQGIIEGTQQPNLYRGLVRLAHAQTLIANDPSRGRAATDAFRALLVAGGLVQTKHDTSSANTATISLSNDVLLRLADVLTSELQRRRQENPQE